MSANLKKAAKPEFVDVQTQYPVFMSLDYMYGMRPSTTKTVESRIYICVHEYM
jgi:hypothetical protein